MDSENDISNRANSKLIKSIRKYKARTQRNTKGYGIIEKGEEQCKSMTMSDGSKSDAFQGCLLQYSSETHNDKAQSDYCDGQMNDS